MENKSYSYSSILLISRVLYISFSLQCFIDIGPKILILFCIWLLSELFLNSKNFFRVLKYRHYTYLFFFLVYLFIALLSSSPSVINNIVAFCSVISPLLMYDLCAIENNKRVRFIINVYTLVCVFNCLFSLYFMKSYGLINLRTYSSISNLSERFYLLRNSFQFTSGLSLIVPIYVYLFVHNDWKDRVKIKAIFLLLIIVFAYTVISAQFLTAILIMLFGSLIALMYENKKRLFVGFILASSALFVLPTIIIALNDSNKDYSVIVTRLEEINMTITGQGEETNDMDARNNLFLNSFNTFISNPIFGISVYKSSNLTNKEIGNHASWIDLLARYGLFAFLLFSMMYLHIKRQMRIYRLALIPFLFFVIGFLNPLWFFHTMSVVFFYSPLLLRIATTSKR